MSFPEFFRLRQAFDPTRVDDVEASVRQQIESLQLETKISAGQSVAITAGSRGIANIHQITKCIVQHLQSIGAEPFIVPAMGSHGGGTPQGQQAVLEGYHITEEYCGCPIRATMETVQVCETELGFPVHFDRFAYEADHVFVCNRIKPHTRFAGEIESGLMKMMLIGLGKHEGAKIYHRAIEDFSFDKIVRSVAEKVLQQCSIVGGIGIVENGYDETAIIEAVRPEDFLQREIHLQRIAKEMLPSLPFDQADVLILDEMGKNISGTGMDTNVLGRKYNDNVAIGDEKPKVTRIFVRDLTPQTHGNATGIGVAEFCTTRLVEKIDRHATQINCITGNHPTAAMIPVHYESDREVLQAALATIGMTDPQDAKVMWIKNTLELTEVECSAGFLAAAKDDERLEVLTQPRSLTFNADGNLPLIGEM